jgi:hypothetical protein
MIPYRYPMNKYEVVLWGQRKMQKNRVQIKNYLGFQGIVFNVFVFSISRKENINLYTNCEYFHQKGLTNGCPIQIDRNKVYAHLIIKKNEKHKPDRSSMDLDWRGAIVLEQGAVVSYMSLR